VCYSLWYNAPTHDVNLAKRRYNGEKKINSIHSASLSCNSYQDCPLDRYSPLSVPRTVHWADTAHSTYLKLSTGPMQPTVCT